MTKKVDAALLSSIPSRLRRLSIACLARRPEAAPPPSLGAWPNLSNLSSRGKIGKKGVGGVGYRTPGHPRESIAQTALLFQKGIDPAER